jgi:hypothetical protein
MGINHVTTTDQSHYFGNSRMEWRFMILGLAGMVGMVGMAAEGTAPAASGFFT